MKILLLVFFSLNVFAVGTDYIIKFKKNYRSLKNYQSLSQSLNIYKISNSDFNKISALDLSQIEYFEENQKLILFDQDPGFKDLWGLKNVGQTYKVGNKVFNGVPGTDIKMEEAWSTSSDGSAFKIGVVDTGINYNHEDLKQNVWTNEKEFNGQAGADDDGNGYIDDIHGFDFFNKDSDPMDDHDHGSHVSGTIAAAKNGVGVTGVSQKASLVGLKVFSAQGSGQLDGVIAAYEYAIKNNIKVLSNSWGVGTFSQALFDIIKAANEVGIIVVASAGNANRDIDQLPQYPGAINLPNVLTVGALDPLGNRAWFSNWGEKTVDIFAPGVAIYSSIRNGYGYMSGTSMATPHVTGLVGLVWSGNQSMNHLDVISQIENTSAKMKSLCKLTKTAGFINAKNAVLSEVQAPIDCSSVTTPVPTGWIEKQIYFSTPHPYPGSWFYTKSFTVPGSKKMKIRFLNIDTEKDKDFVIIKDKTGKEVKRLSGKSKDEEVEVLGDLIRVEFKSSTTNNQWGASSTWVFYQK